MDVTRAREQLQARLDEISHSTSVLGAEGAELGSDDLSPIHEHPGDEGTDISDADREAAILDAGAAERELIEQALGRIESGSYGHCVDCGKQIPDERLAVRPEVARCVEDQQKYEVAMS